MKTPRNFIMQLLLAATLFTLTHCGSDDPKPVVEPVVVEPVVVKPHDVYTAGSFNTGTAYVPAYWKNGNLVKLAETQGDADVIAVDGEDVYVIGSLDDNSNKKRLWKNGVMTDFSDGTNGTYIYSLRILNGDIYAVGMLSTLNGDDATYWKNGIPHTITTGLDSRAYDIAIVGNDIYVVGFQYNENGMSVATFWKNDVGTPLTDGTTYADANGIIVVNNDVYINGHDNSTLKVWKNGVVTISGAEQNSGTAIGGIALLKDDIYVTGYEKNGDIYEAKYWKNGTAFLLPKPTDALSTYCYSIAVAGDDIYFLGETAVNNTYPALVWKNFELMKPYDGTITSSSSCISVSQ
jgi:hypothetical protein